MYYTRGLLPHILHSRFSSAAPFSPNNSPLLDSLLFPFSISVSHLDSQGVEISSRSAHIDLEKGDDGDGDGDVNSNASRLKIPSTPRPSTLAKYSTRTHDDIISFLLLFPSHNPPGKLLFIGRGFTAKWSRDTYYVNPTMAHNILTSSSSPTKLPFRRGATQWCRKRRKLLKEVA